MRRSLWLRGVCSSLLVLILALAVGSGVAGASSSKKKPSLKLSVPASVKTGKAFHVTATGYSGKYNAVGAVTVLATSPCPSPAYAAPNDRKSIAKHHSFKVKLRFVVTNPKPGAVCGYLYTGVKGQYVKGHYIVKRKPYHVT